MSHSGLDRFLECWQSAQESDIKILLVADIPRKVPTNFTSKDQVDTDKFPNMNINAYPCLFIRK